MNYKKIYDQIITNRKNNPYNGYTERHHIIPISLGGSDDKNNLVDLSAREHYICHMLLTKMYSKNTNDYYKMVFAFLMMCDAKGKFHKRNYKINSRIYEVLKFERCKYMSLNQLGDNNSQYDSIWIHNKELRKSKKINSRDDIELGWELGRFINFDFLDRCCDICNTNLKLTNNKTNQRICCYCKTNSFKNTSKGTSFDKKPTNKFKNGKKCYCDGVIYDNVSIASYELNVRHETLRRRLKNPNLLNWYYIN